MTYRVELDNGTAMTLCDEHVRFYSPVAWSVIDSDAPCLLCPVVN